MAVGKDAQGKWEVQVWYKDWQGNRKKKHKRGFLRKKDAEEWERNFLGQNHSAELTMTALIEAFEQDIDVKTSVGTLKSSTAANKKSYLRLYMKEYFRGVACKGVKTRHVNLWLSEISKHCNRGERMSSGTLNIVRNVLSQIFEFGITNFGLTENPVLRSDVIKPYTNDKRVRVWTLEQYNVFYKSLKTERHKVVFNILFWAGLRIGEALALTPDDIADGYISVTKTLSKVNGKTFLTAPKTTSAKRRVAIPSKLEKQIKDYISVCPDMLPSDMIFEITATALEIFMRNRCEKLGLPLISPHILRHSYASHLLQQSKDVALVSHQIGHATSATTHKVYAHMIPESEKAQMPMLDSLMVV